MLRRNTEKRRQIVGNENSSKTKIRKIDFLPALSLIKFFSVPSLESMSTVKIATGLFKQPDIRDAIRKHSLEFDPVDGNWNHSHFHDESFEKVENMILNNISLLSLPNLLKAKVTDVVRPIECQIYDWIRSRKDIDYMESIYWSNEGTIDVVKSFNQLMNKNDSANCSKDNFEMACSHCLEDHIPALFNQLPKKVQNYYFCSERTLLNHFISYWTSTLKNDLNGLMSKIRLFDPHMIFDRRNSVYQTMFELAVKTGNVSAVKYFWNKLTASEISNNLVQWVDISFSKRGDIIGEYPNTNKYSNVTYFLLSQMNDAEQQREVMQKRSDVILKSLFLDWPWQRFLLPTMQAVWSSVSEKAYLKLLLRIAPQIKSCKGAEKWLRKLFLDTPINLKQRFIQYTIEDQDITNLLCNLLSIGDLNTLKLILNYANSGEKRMIMFSLIQNDKVREIIFTNKVASLNTLIDETLSTESDVFNLKERIVLKHGNRLCHDWILEDDWQMVELFFNWAFYSNMQRNKFRNEILDEFEIVYSLLKCRGDYKLTDKFVNWCIGDAQDISQFKKDFAKSKCKIITIGEEDWDLFKKFIGWCFLSDEDIDEFKSHILQCPDVQNIIFRSIVRKFNFEFVDKLIVWCCHSNNEVKLYKEMFVLSQTWMDILEGFVSNYKVYGTGYNNWD